MKILFRTQWPAGCRLARLLLECLHPLPIPFCLSVHSSHHGGERGGRGGGGGEGNKYNSQGLAQTLWPPAEGYLNGLPSIMWLVKQKTNGLSGWTHFPSLIRTHASKITLNGGYSLGKNKAYPCRQILSQFNCNILMELNRSHLHPVTSLIGLESDLPSFPSTV